MGRACAGLGEPIFAARLALIFAIPRGKVEAAEEDSPDWFNEPTSTYLLLLLLHMLDGVL